jgi:hypothetical protein
MMYNMEMNKVIIAAAIGLLMPVFAYAQDNTAQINILMQLVQKLELQIAALEAQASSTQAVVQTLEVPIAHATTTALFTTSLANACDVRYPNSFAGLHVGMGYSNAQMQACIQYLLQTHPVLPDGGTQSWPIPMIKAYEATCVPTYGTIDTFCPNG